MISKQIVGYKMATLLCASMTAFFIGSALGNSRSFHGDLIDSREMCGNGFVDSFEECDDGNYISGDGCNKHCLLEEGYCGDHIVQHALGEECEPLIHGVQSCSAECIYFKTLER